MGPDFFISADSEQARLAVLQSYRIVDTAPEIPFDEIVQLAAKECGTKFAALVLVDEKRSWLKAKIGVEKTEVPREHSFCNHAIREHGVFVVDDARLDPRFNQSPIVTKDGYVFFAGMPLRTAQGHSLGALCILERQSRKLSATERAALKKLSARAMALLEQRRLQPAPAFSSVPPMAENPTGPDHGGQLLVVDDDDAVRTFVCVITRRLGYQVTEAANGIEALDCLEKNPGKIDFVLTDVNMPVMDGLELVRILKAKPDRPAIAVMSGRFDPYNCTVLKAQGVTALLSKPFSSEALRLTLAKAVAEKV